MKKPKLTKKAFKEWLEGHDPNSFIGSNRSECNCPVANFVKDSLPKGYRPYITPTMLEVDWAMQEKSWKLPVWAQEFIYKVDIIDGLSKPARHITAKEALALL